MLVTIAIVLVVLWALGLLTAHAMGGLVHLLLIVACVLVIINLTRGKSL